MLWLSCLINWLLCYHRSRFGADCDRTDNIDMDSLTGKGNILSNYSAKKLEKVLDKVFLYFFRFQRRLPTYI
ncbi:MAG: hypothetical protein KZQ60_19080, partial [Candidatus Thiodiazotropha sp. (ex Lucinoma aequizonata)]|nr:hypothetical protein [Candidatus Thiodiazotropha sp. (ex Lucinoma aequizonata)]